jgi:hypothetical protein
MRRSVARLGLRVRCPGFLCSGSLCAVPPYWFDAEGITDVVSATLSRVCPEAQGLRSSRRTV